MPRPNSIHKVTLGPKRVDKKHRVVIGPKNLMVTVYGHQLKNMKAPAIAILDGKDASRIHNKHLQILGIDPDVLVRHKLLIDSQGRLGIPREFQGGYTNKHDKLIELTRLGGESGVLYAFLAPSESTRLHDMNVFKQELLKSGNGPIISNDIRSKIHVPTLSDDPKLLEEQLDRMRHGY